MLFLIKFMESYRNFEICDQCTQFRELTDNNFHKEAEEFSECGCCLDLDELNEYKESVIKIENWWFKYSKMGYEYCIGHKKLVENALWIGQYPTSEMSCYYYIYMCKNCIEKLKNKENSKEKESIIKIENWYLKYKQLEYKYCIGCEDRNKNAIFIGTYPHKVYKLSLHKYVPDTINIYMCKKHFGKRLSEISDKNSSYSQDSQDSSCYKCTDYGRCYDCEPFNPVFDTWGLPRGYTKMSNEEIRKYIYG